MNITFRSEKSVCTNCYHKKPGVILGKVFFCRDCFEGIRGAIKNLGPFVGDERAGQDLKGGGKV